MQMEERTVNTELGDITYRCIRKPVKHINLRIDRSGQITVSADLLRKKQDIDEFVASKAEWIQKKRHEFRHIDQDLHLQTDEVVLFGNHLKVKWMQERNCLRYDDEYLYVSKSAGKDQMSALSNTLGRLSKIIFEDIVTVTCNKMEKVYAVDVPEIRIRSMKTRWGSCNPSAKRITLNRNLIHYPIDFIEYVILHELAHFVVPNHSADFYAVVSHMMPDYKRRIALIHNR